MAKNKATGRKKGDRPLSIDPRDAALGPLGTQVWAFQKRHTKNTKAPQEVTGRKGKTLHPGETSIKFGRSTVEGDGNALIILRRLYFEDRPGEPKNSEKGRLDGWIAHEPLHTWASSHALGTHHTYLNCVLERRSAMLRQWSGAPPTSGDGTPGRSARRPHVRRLRISAEWRLVTGLGLRFGVLDSGLALHGTYGWPVIPSSTLKGLLASHAHQTEQDQELVRRLLGDPRPGLSPAPGSEGSGGRGSVVFLDALPEPGAVGVHRDVITPHQQPYYTSASRLGDEAESVEPSPVPVTPPAEHHNPVPAPFLSISGHLLVDLVGESVEDLNTVRDWLVSAGEDIGIGARTSAGYGYFTCEDVKEESW
ncbi:type III-B CRISPR module RAMP protein Cmr6 [Nocardiopsis sp. NPDC006938]|uniref:type III-B CRISPR module RAMP protein Cmr6 n=1 Tax=Nocardiopsis sp. NPDC006938 TaxID=3364337 RepID=UPI00367A4A2E